MKRFKDFTFRTKSSIRKITSILILFIYLTSPISSFFKIITSDSSKNIPRRFNDVNQRFNLRHVKKIKSNKIYEPKNVIFTFSKGSNNSQQNIKISEKEFLRKAGISNDQMKDFLYINKILSILNKNNTKKKKFKKIIKKNLNRHLDFDVLLKEDETNSRKTSFEIIQWKLEYPDTPSRTYINNFRKDIPKKMSIYQNYKNNKNSNKYKNSKKFKKSLFPFTKNNSLKKNHEKISIKTVDKTISTNDCQFVLPFIDPRDKTIRNFKPLQNLQNNTPKPMSSPITSSKYCIKLNNNNNRIKFKCKFA